MPRVLDGLHWDKRAHFEPFSFCMLVFATLVLVSTLLASSMSLPFDVLGLVLLDDYLHYMLHTV
ncbi:hypothetical protein [Pelistega sp. MC2]|uniref:hypothetical protein n=1 Tax=Pelistega sp. MC2 TaxID=1720297 RepID=UPI0008D95744|nr:hypothetical protein [Pelistega sp. MC2]